MLECPRCGKRPTDRDAAFCPFDGTALGHAKSSESLVGKRLADRYLVLHPIGEGGMGRVYLAQDLGLRRLVAIKVLTSESTDPAAVGRFVREAAAAARIAHVNVASLFELGRVRDGGPLYLVLEFVAGVSLDTEIGVSGALLPARATHVACQIAYALEAAHARGILHRDVKPGNVLLTQQGADTDFVKLVDFGIARGLGSDDPALPAVTPPDVVPGTPPYIAPEQWMGHHLDARTDVYALGITLFEMLTGTLPFDAPSHLEGRAAQQHIGAQHLREPRPTPSSRQSRWVIPDALDAIVLRCIQRAPTDRYASMSELMRDLGRVWALLATPQLPSEVTYAGTTAAPPGSTELDHTPYQAREVNESDLPGLVAEIARLVDVRTARLERLLAALWRGAPEALPAEVAELRRQARPLEHRITETSSRLALARDGLRVHDRTVRQELASAGARGVEAGATAGVRALGDVRRERDRIVSRSTLARQRLELAQHDATLEIGDLVGRLAPTHARTVALVLGEAVRHPEVRPLVEEHGEIDGAVTRYLTAMRRANAG